MTDNFFYSKVSDKITRPEVIAGFPEIREFGHQRYLNIKPESLKMHFNEGIEICFVSKGRYDWNIEDKCYHLFPGDGFVTCPWEWHGSSKEIVDWGEIYWLIVSPEIFEPNGKFKLSPWSRLSKEESKLIGQTLASNTNPIIPKAFQIRNLLNELYFELGNKLLGYPIRIYSILENLLITVSRMLQSQHIEQKEKHDWVLSLESLLNTDISKKWSVEEMAACYQMGTTSFNEKTKKLTGFTPSSLLINLRIEKAKSLLKNTGKNLTDISMECGFYSLQHFSASFLKRTGESPSKFRENILGRKKH